MTLTKKFLLMYLYERKNTITDRIARNRTLGLTNEHLKEFTEFDMLEDNGRLCEIEKMIKMIETFGE